MSSRLWRLGGPTFLAVAVVGLLGIWPAHRASNEAGLRIDAASTAIEALQSQAEVLRPLTDQADDIRRQIAELNVLVPVEHDIAEFVVELDRVADLVDIDLRDVVPTQADRIENDPTTPRGWTSFLLGVRVVGEYADIVGFAAALEDTQRLVVIDRISIATGVSGLLVGDLELRVFSSVDAEGVALAAIEGPP